MARVEKWADKHVAVMVSSSGEFEALGDLLLNAVRAEAASRRDTGEFSRGLKKKRVAHQRDKKLMSDVRDWIIYNDSDFAGAIELGFIRQLEDGSLYHQKGINAFRGAIAKLAVG